MPCLCIENDLWVCPKLTAAPTKAVYSLRAGGVNNLIILYRFIDCLFEVQDVANPQQK